jgi:hypothetical protein
MNIIHKPRQSGKTTDLIKISHETGCYIVCADYVRVLGIINRAKELRLSVPFPLTFQEFIEGHYSAMHVVIDDLDDFLIYISRARVLAVTLTKED